jgi:hypothetical protein
VFPTQVGNLLFHDPVALLLQALDYDRVARLLAARMSIEAKVLQTLLTLIAPKPGLISVLVSCYMPLW